MVCSVRATNRGTFSENFFRRFQTYRTMDKKSERSIEYRHCKNETHNQNILEASPQDFP